MHFRPTLKKENNVYKNNDNRHCRLCSLYYQLVEKYLQSICQLFIKFPKLLRLWHFCAFGRYYEHTLAYCYVSMYDV